MESGAKAHGREDPSDRDRQVYVEQFTRHAKAKHFHFFGSTGRQVLGNTYRFCHDPVGPQTDPNGLKYIKHFSY